VLLDVLLILVILGLAGYIYTLYNPTEIPGASGAEESAEASGSEDAAAGS
jgi:hypothetical protein